MVSHFHSIIQFQDKLKKTVLLYVCREKGPDQSFGDSFIKSRARISRDNSEIKVISSEYHNNIITAFKTIEGKRKLRTITVRLCDKRIFR